MRRMSGFFFACFLVFTLACSGQNRKTKPTENVDDAIADVKKQLESSPNSSTLHGQMATLLATKGDWEGSDKETTKNRIIKGPHEQTWYHDQSGHEYLLDDILTPLKKKLSKMDK